MTRASGDCTAAVCECALPAKFRVERGRRVVQIAARGNQGTALTSRIARKAMSSEAGGERAERGGGKGRARQGRNVRGERGKWCDGAPREAAHSVPAAL